MKRAQSPHMLIAFNMIGELIYRVFIATIMVAVCDMHGIHAWQSNLEWRNDNMYRLV
jgi:hypothetical protein